MSNPDNGSYISRFLVKFVEIIAAGLATAASGYMIAHLSATLSSSTPTTNNRAIVATPNLGEKAAVPAQPATATSAGNSQQPIIPPLAAPLSPQPTTTANIKAEPPSRRIENNPKPATRESWTVRVRAALANAAHRSDPTADSPHRSRPAAGIAAPAPATDAANSNAISPTMPAATELRAAPPQQTTQGGGQAGVIVASPPTVIEVNPVVPIQPSPAAPEKAPAALSTLEQMLRNDPLAGSDQAPRPPMPVGQE